MFKSEENHEITFLLKFILIVRVFFSFSTLAFDKVHVLDVIKHRCRNRVQEMERKKKLAKLKNI